MHTKKGEVPGLGLGGKESFSFLGWVAQSRGCKQWVWLPALAPQALGHVRTSGRCLEKYDIGSPQLPPAKPQL